MKIDTIKQLQDQLDSYRRSQNTDADRLRKEISELQSKVIEKEEVITQLHYKFEDLIQSQVIEIPIYAGPKAKKGKNTKKMNRSKSQIRQGPAQAIKTQLQFIREMPMDQEQEEGIADRFIMDDEDDQSLRNVFMEPKKRQ
jgi:hypothetical protein